VIGTTCTGHSDHMGGPGVVVVESGESAPSDDYLGATAPTVSEDQILSALTVGYSQAISLHQEAVKHADELADLWSWERCVAPAVEQMKELIE